MKKLLCISILIISYCHAQEIPSLSELKDRYPDVNINKNNSSRFLSAQIDLLLNKSIDELADILNKWYSEDPAMFQAKWTIKNNEGQDQELTLTDLYTVRAEAEKYLPQEYNNEFIKKSTAFANAVAHALKNLGIPFTLSDEELTAFAKTASREM